MPGRDGTGPEGRGRMTGGGSGECIVRVEGDVPAGFARRIGGRLRRMAAPLRGTGRRHRGGRTQ